MTIPEVALEAAARAIHDLGCEHTLFGNPCTHPSYPGDAAHLEAHAALSAALPYLRTAGPAPRHSRTMKET